MESLKIVILSTVAAIAYGVLHDQVTAHICVEYFSVAHPPVFATKSPFLLALGWGIIATWWVGLPLGIGLAIAARAGQRRKLRAAEIRASIIGLMLACALGAVISGILGAVLVANGVAPVPGGWADRLPPSKYVPFAADAWAHVAGYGIGLLGGIVVIAHTALRRHH